MNKEQFLEAVIDNSLVLSYSSMAALLKSPRHFLEYKTKQTKQTPAMAFGSAFHCFVLEPEEFENRYIISKDINKKTKAGKEAFALLQEHSEGKTIINEADWATIQRMSEAISRNKTVSTILQQGSKEQHFETSYQGVALRGVRDVYDEMFGTTDLKTCADANPKKFARKALYDFMYHLQAAIYTIDNKTSYTIIAVDQNCFVSTFNFSDDAIKLGLKILAKAIFNYKALQAETIKGNTDVWLQGYEYWYPFGYEINI